MKKIGVKGEIIMEENNIHQDEIVRMAREAGLEYDEPPFQTEFVGTSEQLERFAALVAAHEREKHVDLTNDEIANLFKSAYPQSSIMDCDISLGKRIIAAFKEKNK